MQRLIILILSLILLNSCGFFKYTDQRGQPTSGIEKAKKNVAEGKGLGIKGLVGGRGTNYEFSTSNPLWRASLETLDFLPLTTVDYSGGIIITDWYSDNNNKDEIKITIRFLDNEVRSDSIKIIVHKKKCNLEKNCKINEINSLIKSELTKTILSKAAILEKNKKLQK